MLGIPRTTMSSRVGKLGLKDVLVANKPVVPGFSVSKISTNYNKDGDLTQQWVQQKPEAVEREAAFRAFVEELIEPIKGLSPIIPAPTTTDSEIMVVYPIGDHHHGLYADGEETGDDYDCKIASSLLTGAVDRLASLAPPASQALLLNLGDYFHADDSSNATPEHGNKLDVDTRYGRVMQSGAMALIHCVLRLLERHEKVIVWNMPGNHDPHAYFALAMAMSFYFHNEPRVEVDLSTGLFKYLRFGKNLIASHHGHGPKIPDLPLIMAADRQEDWAATDFRVWHCGHIHHKTVKEFPGCTVETHRTLAGKDAWHAGKGYRSGRDMTSIVYHRHYGEIQRTRCDLEMLKAA